MKDPGDQAESQKFSRVQACALNTMNMFGTGPFITIPYVIACMNPPGPHALIGYAIVSVACVMDSFVWSELGSMWPLRGGSYVYLLNLYGREKWGRLLSFIFIWQFLVTAPMEIASGFIAIAQYLSYITGIDNYQQNSFLAFFFCLLSIFGLYRKVSEIGKLTTFLWLATLSAIMYTIIAGFSHFDSSNFALPAGAFSDSGQFVLSLGAVCRFGVYDFTGYYDVCQIGDDLVEPRTTIPFAVTRTCMILCIIYFLVHLSVLGYLPYSGPDGFLTGTDEPTHYIMSLFCERMFGRPFAIFFTIVVCVTIFGANFAMMCGSLYVPFAAAQSGHFFSALAKTDPTRGDLPTYSLLFIGAISLVFCFLRIEVLVHTMMTIMLLVQFLGQSVGLLYVRLAAKDSYKEEYNIKHKDIWLMPAFPLPLIFQIVTFTFVFLTTDNYMISGRAPLLELSFMFLGVGCLAYFCRAMKHRQWPFNPESTSCEPENVLSLPPESPMMEDMNPSITLSPKHIEIKATLSFDATEGSTTSDSGSQGGSGISTSDPGNGSSSDPGSGTEMHKTSTSNTLIIDESCSEPLMTNGHNEPSPSGAPLIDEQLPLDPSQIELFDNVTAFLDSHWYHSDVRVPNDPTIYGRRDIHPKNDHHG